MRFFFTMFYNCTNFQNNQRGSVEKHPKICWIDLEWPTFAMLNLLSTGDRPDNQYIRMSFPSKTTTRMVFSPEHAKVWINF